MVSQWLVSNVTTGRSWSCNTASIRQTQELGAWGRFDPQLVGMMILQGAAMPYFLIRPPEADENTNSTG